jgi:hypothetical protein
MVVVFRALSRALSYRQRCVLAVVRTVSGSLSLIASSIIVYKIYLRYIESKKSAPVIGSGSFRSNNKKNINTYYRMMLVVSILDILHSFWTALSVLPTPPSSGGVFSHGTTATCSTQAFFAQLTTPIVLYMATMNTYFMLKIRYNVPDRVIEKSYECWFHAIPIGIWLVTGIAGLSLKIFNTIALPELGCWISPYPRGCTFTNTCTRGFKIAEYLDWYVWSFSYLWLFVGVIVVLVNALLIYSAIRRQEQRNAKYLASKLQSAEVSIKKIEEHSAVSATSPEGSLPEFDFIDDTTSEIPKSDVEVVKDSIEKPDDISGFLVLPISDEKSSATPINHSGPKPEICVDDSNNNVTARTATLSPRHTAKENARKIKNSRKAAVQSSLYLLSALFTAVWIFLPWLGNKLLVEARVRFFFAFMVNIVSPSQGLFNLFIFVRLQYLRLRETNQDWSRWRCVKQCLVSAG